MDTPFASDPRQRELDTAPDIRTEPPVAPGSESSRLAAAALDGPFRRKSWRTIMRVMAVADRPLTREEIAERTGYKESSLCGRLSTQELRPEWIEALSCYSTSSAGVAVDAYQLTPAGRARCAASNIRGAA